MKFDLMEEFDKPASEEVIARSIVDVASELRLVDASVMVTMIQNGREASISDLVNSSTEMYFRSGTLQYALSAQCRVCWEEPPTVGIDLEFRYDNVTAYFKLTIGRDKAGVELIHLNIDGDADTADARARCLELAMANARVRGDSHRASI